MTTIDSKGSGGFLPAFLNVLGTLIIVVVIALCLPLALPRVFGYEPYEVVSGSMEPAIPVGSVVYAKQVEATSVQQGDIIAFSEANGVVVHRVTVNRTSSGEFATKGDANPIDDINPVPYSALLGRVELTIPMLGSFMTVYSSLMGKIYMLMLLVCGVLLNMLARRMRATRRAQSQLIMESVLNGTYRSDNAASGQHAAAHASEPVRRRSSVGRKLRIAAIAVLAVIFVGSGAVIGYTMWQHALSDALYHDASDRYTQQNSSASPLQDAPPIKVDFASLQAENPDIIGWIYCEGTPIDYPVLYSHDNDKYLRTDYTGEYNMDGSIFIDGDNNSDLTDSNTIIYGHHMNSGSMFACLEKWADQSFYNEHPFIWLLTPSKNYKIMLFSGRHVDSRSDLYQIIAEPGPRLDAMLAEALEDSDFTPDLTKVVPGYDPKRDPDASSVHLNPRGRYVMLSTCAYVFEGARYVLHGLLVEV